MQEILRRRSVGLSLLGHLAFFAALAYLLAQITPPMAGTGSGFTVELVMAGSGAGSPAANKNPALQRTVLNGAANKSPERVVKRRRDAPMMVHQPTSHVAGDSESVAAGGAGKANSLSANGIAGSNGGSLAHQCRVIYIQLREPFRGNSGITADAVFDSERFVQIRQVGGVDRPDVILQMAQLLIMCRPYATVPAGTLRIYREI